jgi:hypothetical protein
LTKFANFLKEEGIDYFVIKMTEDQVPHEAIVNEGRWIPSGRRNFMMRVDAENPSIKQQRHVHVAQKKHISTKYNQAAWNQNGTKHDQKSFNSKIGSLDVVQSIARDALGLPDSIKLEESSRADKIIMMNESDINGIEPVLFILKMA